MSYDEEQNRGFYEHLRSNGYQRWDADRAGVTGYDSPETAFNKLDAQRKKDQSVWIDPNLSSGQGQSSHSFGGGGGDIDPKGALGCVLALIFLVCSPIIIGMTVLGIQNIGQAESWIREKGREFATAQVAAERVRDYSDFSQLSDWPKNVQETFRRQEYKPLIALLDEVPEKLNTLSTAKKAELGAQIWFRISDKRSNAEQYLIELQATPHRVKSPVLRAGALSVTFLRQECAKGVEPACLDAAKSFASLLWNGTTAFDEKIITDMALKELPSTGPLAKSPAIETLRKKLSDPPADTLARKAMKALH